MQRWEDEIPDQVRNDKETEIAESQQETTTLCSWLKPHRKDRKERKDRLLRRQNDCLLATTRKLSDCHFYFEWVNCTLNAFPKKQRYKNKKRDSSSLTSFVPPE